MEVILKDSSKYAKIKNCKTGYIFYKDRPTIVPDNYKLEDEMKVYGTEEVIEESPVEKQETKPETEPKTQKVDDFKFLLEIKGIGKETLDDIKRLYLTLEDLKQALKENKVPLRNDIVKKLKKLLK